MVLQQAVNETTEPKCDRGEAGAPCGARAVFAYQWDWGEKGMCCAHHATLLQQIASQIGRGVACYPIQATAPEPLTRDERTTLKARALVVEEELEELKSRGLDLYRVNGDLVRQNATLAVQNRELGAQVKDLGGQVLQLQGQLEERDAEHAELVVEIERLRTIEALVAPLQGPPGAVVD
jgi:hypothetical protein